MTCPCRDAEPTVGTRCIEGLQANSPWTLSSSSVRRKVSTPAETKALSCRPIISCQFIVGRGN